MGRRRRGDGRDDDHRSRGRHRSTQAHAERCGRDGRNAACTDAREGTARDDATQARPARAAATQTQPQTQTQAPTDALPLTPAPAPTLELAAQGPASASDELDLAIRRGRAIEVGDLVAHLVAGDRDWYHAMDTCRGRGFWGTSGWRVPTVAELRAIARTRTFPDRAAWSTRRGASDATAAIAVTLVGGTTETVDKNAGDIATICVKRRA
jgi:hypothetical protein